MAPTDLHPCPLPPRPTTYEEWREYRPTYLSAYSLAFDAENYATNQAEANENREDDIISARVAGYLLVELFTQLATERPCNSLAKQLLSQAQESEDTHDVIFRVGKWHRDHLLRCFRKLTAKYPRVPWGPSWNPAFDTVEEIIKEYTKADGKDYEAARRKVLARDGFRCILTGMFDEPSVRRSRKLAQMCDDLQTASTGVIACKIMDVSTAKDVDPVTDGEDSPVVNETHFDAGAMSILRNFGLEDLAQRLTQNGVYGLGNLISLDTTSSFYLNRLNLWFERTDEKNCYHVCVAGPRYAIYMGLFGHVPVDRLQRPYVTFTQCDESQEVPDAQLLGLHAACARVAHLSDASKVFYELEREMEDTNVLAHDGSSARLLDHLLAPFVTSQDGRALEEVVPHGAS